MELRERLEAELAKPLAETEETLSDELFDPWHGVIDGIYGSYSSESDRLMIAALEAARDGKTFELINKEGFAAEFILYVLAGHGLIEYGTSPRGGWPDYTVKDLWQPLIDKWRGYYVNTWGEQP